MFYAQQPSVRAESAYEADGKGEKSFGRDLPGVPAAPRTGALSSSLGGSSMDASAALDEAGGPQETKLNGT